MQMMMMDSDDSDSDQEDDEDSATGMDGFFYERAFEAVEQLLDGAAADWCRDSAIFSDRDETGSVTESIVVKTKPPPPPVASKSHRGVHNGQQQQHSRHRGMAILDRMRSLEENGGSVRSGGKEVSASASLENLKSISQRRMELSQAVSSAAKTPGDESETSSQHSTSTVNTVVEVHPAGGGFSDDLVDSHSPVHQRRTGATVVMVRSQPRKGPDSLSPTASSSSSSSASAVPLPKGWVKHIIGKLQGDAK
jgi:hypothetical protein